MLNVILTIECKFHLFYAFYILREKKNQLKSTFFRYWYIMEKLFNEGGDYIGGNIAFLFLKDATW